MRRRQTCLTTGSCLRTMGGVTDLNRFMNMQTFRALSLALACLMTACSFGKGSTPEATPNKDNIIFVTATPHDVQAQAAPTTLPTAAPPTPEPVSTIEPSLLLQLGDQFMRDGYLEDAAGIYRTLLNYGEAVGAEFRALAAFRLGKVALRDGYFQQALDAFNLLIREFPASVHSPQSYLMRGDAHMGVSNWTMAITDFEGYLAARPGLIDSYVYERIADARIALGQTDLALQNYEKAIAAKRSKVPLLILREKLAGIYISLSRATDAVAQYDAILSVARNVPYRANISYSAAQALLDANLTDAGWDRMRSVFESYAGTPASYDALKILEATGIQYDGLTRGKSAFYAGDYQTAIDAFNAFTTSQQLEAVPAELHLLLGRAYRQIGNADAAMIAFQTIIDQYPQDPLFGDALLERGRTRFLAGDIPAAIEIYLSVADNYDYLGDAAGEALWRAGYLYGTNGDTSLSRQIFTRLADSYPSHELTTNGLFIAASAAVRDEAWSIAENLYGRIASLTEGEDQAAAYLWVGRLAAMRGKQQAANEAFELAVAAAPDSYFAARAGDFRIGRQPFDPPSSYNFSFDINAEVQQAEAWLRQVFALEEEGHLWRMSEELNRDPRLVRGRELFAVGAFDEASTEFEDLAGALRESGDALGSYRLAIHLRGLGAFRESIIAAADVIIASKTGTLGAPRFLARLRFPDYYADLVRREGETRDIDPLLMLSLIRQESLFDTYATAAAGEKGLMQVIPSTAKYIAERLDWRDYQHSDLFRPYAGIAFGAFYIDEQLDLFDQNAVVALAAYNAGPGRAYQWNELSGGDPDLFMTTITIDSTRKYVQFIYRNYNIYRELYGAE